MTKQNLISKLNKMNVEVSILDLNGYNKDFLFTINNKKYAAGFTDNNIKIEDLTRIIYYDNTNQCSTRLFFKTFKALLKNAYN